MTTDLEKQFFDTFGIEPAYFYECSYKDKLDFGLNPSDDECPAKTSNIRCDACNLGKKVLVGYPVITDHRYLLMLAYLTCCDDKEYGTNETLLKEKILENMIQEQRLDKLAFEKGWESFDGFKTKDFVQALFKE